MNRRDLIRTFSALGLLPLVPPPVTATAPATEHMTLVLARHFAREGMTPNALAARLGVNTAAAEAIMAHLGVNAGRMGAAVPDVGQPPGPVRQTTLRGGVAGEGDADRPELSGNGVA